MKDAPSSYAVMAQRHDPKDSPDYFPTPPWATRALIEHVIGNVDDLRKQVCLEPACGTGDMARPLAEYFGRVESSDAFEYGFGARRDFLEGRFEDGSMDWVITNPPFRLAKEFVLRALPIARRGVAVIARTSFIEGVDRYRTIFEKTPMTTFAPFVERVPMVKGRLDKKATTATAYAWLLWRLGAKGPTQVKWIPPCRKALERDEDYHAPFRRAA